MSTNYISVLNYNSGQVIIKELDETDEQLLEVGIDEFFHQHDLNADECAWMFTDKKPHIDIF